MTSPIVSTDWLTDRLLDPTIKVIEVSSKLGDEAPYRTGHIPGAVNFYWKDLCWHDSDREFVTPGELANRLGKVGVSEKDRIVLYGDPVQYGTYALWALTMAGHPEIFILDGSRTKWVMEGRPMTDVVPEVQQVDYVAQNGDVRMRLGRENLLNKLKEPSRFLLDVRSPEEYSGERVMEYGNFDHGAERGGRIPGAKHLYYKDLLNPDDSFKKPEELLEIFKNVGCIPDDYKEVVCYCRLSHRATFAWTALTHVLGNNNIFIYDGSWTEWGSIVGYPIER